MNIKVENNNLLFPHIDSKASSLLDMMRFLAAFTVFIFHFNNSGFIPWPNTDTSIVTLTVIRVLKLWFSMGYAAVIVFFVLSGYLVSASVIKLFETNTWSWKRYLIIRLTRLWVVLLPALLLAFGWATLQIHLFGDAQYIFNTYRDIHNLKPLMSWEVFMGNVFFLQNIRSPIFAGNGVLWSLSYEFWYYILFPCIILIFRESNRYKKLFYEIVVLSIILFIGNKIALYFLIWLLGYVVTQCKPLRITKGSVRIALLSCYLILLTAFIKIIYRLFKVSGNGYDNTLFAPDLLIGIAFAFLIFIIVSNYNYAPSKKSVYWYKILSKPSKFSFTLYLTHLPILHLMRAWRDANASYFTIIISQSILAVVLIIIYALVVYWLIESRTKQVRDFFIRFIDLFETKRLMHKTTKIR